MDLHERFMNHRTAEVALLRELLIHADDYGLYPTSEPDMKAIFHLSSRFSSNIVNRSPRLENSETVRTILCLVYQVAQLEGKKLYGCNIDIDKIHMYLNSGTELRDEIVRVLLDIIVLQSALCDDEQTIIKNYNHSQETLYSQIDNKKTTDMGRKLVEVFINGLILRKKLKGLTNEGIIQLSAIFIMDITAWLKFTDDAVCRPLFLLLPKMIDLNGPSNILPQLWDTILKLSDDPKKTLTTLCLIADVCFPVEFSPHVNLLVQQCMEERFWQLLSAGLIHPVQQQRKQALYLLKRAVDFIDSHRTMITDFSSNDYNEITPLMCVGNVDMQESLQKVRNNFFLIIEVLEEKQKHLVTPVLPLMKNLIRANLDHKKCKNCFHVAWIQCVFRRILLHENNAVVKWGLVNAFNLDLAIYNDQFFKLLLEVLNNTFLYENEDNDDLPAPVTGLLNLLNRAKANEVDLVKKLIFNASGISWGPIALFYVTEVLAMMNVKIYNPWQNDQLKAVKSLLEKNLCMHSRTLRIASQTGLLTALTHFTTEISDLGLLANTLYAFPTGEALKRNSTSWNQVCGWLKRIVKINDAVSFVEKACDQIKSEEPQTNMSIRSFSLMVMLLNDANLVLSSDNCAAGTALNNLLRCLIGADSRLYGSAHLRDRSVELMSCLLDFCKSGDSSSIYTLISPYVDAALRYIFKNLRRLSDLTNYDRIHNYVLAISRFFNDKDIDVSKRELLNHVERFEMESLLILEDAELSTNVQRLFGLQILHVCLKAVIGQPKKYTYICPLLSTYVMPITTQSSDEKEIKVCKDNSNLKGRIASEYYQLVAELIYEYVKEVPVDFWIPNVDWLEHMTRLVEIGGKEIIIPIVAALKEVIDKKPLDTTEVDSLRSIVRVCWRSTFECRKTELFWLAMDKLIRLLFSSSFIVYEETKKLLKECTNEMLEEGNNVPGLNRMFLKGLELLNVIDTEFLFDFHEQLLACLLHGDVPRRDQRVEIQVHSYIAATYGKSNSDYLSMMYSNIDASTRAQATVLLHKMIAVNPQHAAKLLPLAIAKLDKDKNKRYFADSLLHRIKHRIMQVLLILQPTLNEEDSKRLHHFMCEVMLLESNQPSVRFMQEWLLVRLYLAHESLREKVLDLFEQGNEKRPGSLSSVISVVYHVARQLTKERQQDFILLVISSIAPCCMAQQFNVRLYGQVVLAKLVEWAMEYNYTTIIAKYNSMYSAVVKSLQHGNLQKNSVKIQEDFYFTIFHPDDDYSLQTLYYELPRLANICTDEWIQPKLFEIMQFNTHVNHPMKLYNSKPSMSQAEVSPHMLKSSASGGPAADDIDSPVDGSENIQKKIIPWKSMTPVDDDLSEVSECLAARTKALSEKDGIIVVASLIDRPPNLGGLSRTCEIFGAKEFVLASLKHTEDKQFQSLSVSAEKWIPITEVKPHQLPQYLMEKKQMGYMLVGAEQTANSKNLREMTFDKKTVLLLGNEKEGIPANLIPLLDVCVEIPQVGVVRSLNVHVTGAICIWQYSKQHTLS